MRVRKHGVRAIVMPKGLVRMHEAVGRMGS